MDISKAHCPVRVFSSQRKMSSERKPSQVLQGSLKIIPKSFVSTESLITPSSQSKTEKDNFIEQEKSKSLSSRYLSLRKKKSQFESLSHYKSLSNIYDFNKSESIQLKGTIDSTRRLSAVNNGSIVSLFYEDSQSVDYKINWTAIFEKIKAKTFNEIETELVNYFHNTKIDLRTFPLICMYRFITFNDVMGVVFTRILSSESRVDFREEIMRTTTKMVDIDYDMNSYDISKLIGCNVKKLKILVQDYNERRMSFPGRWEEVKEIVGTSIKNPENSERIFKLIDSLCKKFQLFGIILVSLITSMSIWKLSQDLPYLYQFKTDDTIQFTTYDTILREFRNSQEIIEQQIMTLSRECKDERSQNILELLNKVSMESLELSLCLPIFEDKLRRDNKIAEALEVSSKISREEQFV